jgi:3',5'-nucleoside bisphosphate phosphatase
VDYNQDQLKIFKAELHCHTVLSPCASVEMIPPLIIAEAESKRINLLAITDHNSIANVQSVIEAAKGSNVTVLPGIELQTREEIHSICLFDTYHQLETFFSEIEHTFPKIKNNSDFFGEQYVVDKTGDFIRIEDRLLITSSNLTLKEAFTMASTNNGLLIPAHVNRTAYGLLPVLGLIPDDINIEIVEISKHFSPEATVEKFAQLKDCKIIQNGDAHFLKEIIGFNQFHINKPTINEIKLALLGNNNRSYKHMKPSK